MDENLFNVAAKLQMDRRYIESQRQIAGSDSAGVGVMEGGRATRQWLAFGAALLVNLAVLGMLEWSAYLATPVPEGKVVITQLDTTNQVQVASN